MRILLINPPRSPKNLIAHYAPDDLKEQLNRIGIIGPPLSLCSIAGNLPEFDVEIFDLKAEYDLGLNLSLDEAVLKKLGEFEPDIVGVTFLTSDYNQGCIILRLTKGFNPSILTVAGGIHASLCPRDFQLPYIDITVLGPGKKIFRDIAIEHTCGGDFTRIPNIIIQKNCSTPYSTKMINLFEKSENLLPHVFSNRQLVKKYRDAYRVGESKEPIAFIETSLGCPSRCTFCSIWPVNNGGYYKRGVENIIRELKTMTDYKLIRFVDANTMGDITHSSMLFDRIIEEQFNIELVMDLRADTAANYPWLIEKATKAGLKVAIVGIESDSEEELQYYNKDCSRDVVLRAIEVLNRYGVNVRGICIVQPNYDENDFQRLMGFLYENNLTHSAFSIMTPFPGTLLYSKVKDKIVIKDLDYYNLFNSVFKTKLPEQEFYALTAELFRDRQGLR